MDVQSARCQSERAPTILLMIQKRASYTFRMETEPFPSSNRIPPDKYRLLETVATAPGARNMALDLKTKRIFLPLSDRGPPSPTSPRGAFMPGTFRVLVFGM